MNIINTSKISKIMALSALVFVFGVAISIASPVQAHASTYKEVYKSKVVIKGNYPVGYYGGGYYPSPVPIAIPEPVFTNPAPAAPVTVTVSTPVTVSAPITVVTGGSEAPIAYNPYPTYPTYPTNDYNNYPPTYYNQNITGSCYAQTTTANAGQNVTWVASAYGGTGNYTYSWSGTGGLYGYGSTMYFNYNTSGTMVANVTITSGGQSISVPCSNSVTVYGYNNNNYYNYNAPVNYPPTYAYPTQVNNGNYNNNNGGLTIGCAADASSVRVGVPVTWSVEVTGGNGNYSYAWSGTDGLAGSQTSVATTYENSGQKNAVVIVTSSDGLTGSKSCTPVTVLGAGGNGNGGSNTTVNPNTNTNGTNGNNSGLSAASLFSLGNIPWGWVAVLIILVLFGTVMYMLFNKSKI